MSTESEPSRELDSPSNDVVSDVNSGSDAGENAAAEAGLSAEVLKQTEWNDETDSVEDAELMETLRGVAEKYPGAELGLEPVGLELVSAALEHHFGRLNLSQEAWERMCHRVARSLLEDPLSHDRWLELWEHLKGGEQ